MPFDFAHWHVARHGGTDAQQVASSSRELGVTPRFVRMLLAGDRRPQPTLVKLCMALDAIDELGMAIDENNEPPRAIYKGQRLIWKRP